MITSFPFDSGRLNAQYLIVALLENAFAFASNEHKLIGWWRLLKLSGALLTVDHSGLGRLGGQVLPFASTTAKVA